VALYQLPLGTHGFAVTATDTAGNVSTQSLTFATTTSLRDIRHVLERDARAVIDSLEGTAVLPQAVSGR
jgi:hypothetical protein